MFQTTGRKKFSRSLTTRMQMYAAIHFFILSELQRYIAGHYNVISYGFFSCFNEKTDPFRLLLLFLQELEPLRIYIGCAYVLISLCSLGLLFNQNRFFPWLEMIRCLFFIGASFYIPLHDGLYWLKVIIYVVRIFHLLSAWMCQYECVESFRAVYFDKAKQHKIMRIVDYTKKFI